MRDDCPQRKLKHLFELLIFSFPLESELKKRRSRRFEMQFSILLCRTYFRGTVSRLAEVCLYDRAPKWEDRTRRHKNFLEITG